MTYALVLTSSSIDKHRPPREHFGTSCHFSARSSDLTISYIHFRGGTFSNSSHHICMYTSVLLVWDSATFLGCCSTGREFPSSFDSKIVSAGERSCWTQQNHNRTGKPQKMAVTSALGIRTFLDPIMSPGWDTGYSQTPVLSSSISCYP